MPDYLSNHSEVIMNQRPRTYSSMPTLPGIAALTTAVILSIAFMLVGASIGFISLYSRSNILSATLKTEMNANAEACLEEGLLRLSFNNTYQGNETFTRTINGQTIACTIDPIVTNGSNKTVEATASTSTANTEAASATWQMVVNATTLARVSMTEVTKP